MLYLMNSRRSRSRMNIKRSDDKIRKKYGNKIIQLAVVHKEPKLKELDVKGEHVIHPYSFFRHD